MLGYKATLLWALSTVQWGHLFLEGAVVCSKSRLPNVLLGPWVNSVHDARSMWEPLFAVSYHKVASESVDEDVGDGGNLRALTESWIGESVLIKGWSEAAYPQCPKSKLPGSKSKFKHKSGAEKERDPQTGLACIPHRCSKWKRDQCWPVTQSHLSYKEWWPVSVAGTNLKVWNSSGLGLCPECGKR